MAVSALRTAYVYLRGLDIVCDRLGYGDYYLFYVVSISFGKYLDGLPFGPEGMFLMLLIVKVMLGSVLSGYFLRIANPTTEEVAPRAIVISLIFNVFMIIGSPEFCGH